MKNKALFIDRDGVINHMVRQSNGAFDSPQTETQVSLVEGIAELIAYCNNNQIPVVEISNQPGVAKGKMTLRTLEAIETKVHDLLKKEGVLVNATYRCLHHPDAIDIKYKINCDCRKPKPGLLLRAANDLNIDLQKSIFLGDNTTDIDAAKNALCTPILFFHENDEPQKLEAKKLCKTQYCTTSHQETLSLIQKLL